MKTVGLFEAKTKLSELCQHVAKSGEPCTITLRGKPLVCLEPIHDVSAEHVSIWDKRDRHLQEYGLLEPAERDFELPARLPTARPDPLA